MYIRQRNSYRIATFQDVLNYGRAVTIMVDFLAGYTYRDTLPARIDGHPSKY